MPDPVPTGDNDPSKVLAENLYKRGTEIAGKNKTLSLLSRLYAISILALELKELAERLCEVIREDFSCELVGILLYDAEQDELTQLAFSESERLSKMQADADFFFEKIDQPLPQSAFLKQVIAKREYGYAENFEDLWKGIAPSGLLEEVRNEGHVRSSLAYPLLSGGVPIGVLILSLNRTYEQLLDHEKESLDSFINVVAVALDQARLYRELKRLNRELTDANKQQIILIHFITHQLKGFVTKSRNAFSMLLEGDFGQLPDTMRAIVEEGFRSDTKGVNTIQEILNAANIKSGKVTYVKEALDFKGLVEGVANELKPNADAKGLVFGVTADGGDFTLPADRMQLVNAVKNLIDNSIKYTLTGSVDIALTRDGGNLRLEVKDTGIGITPEDMQFLFTEGGHGKESRKVNVESTGFGLYIVKNIIEAHQGKVWAESDGPGKGSRFIVELPIIGN